MLEKLVELERENEALRAEVRRQTARIKRLTSPEGGLPAGEVTSRQLAEEWVRIFGSAIQSTGEGILVMAAASRPFRLRVMFVNDGFSRITGIPAEGATGNPLSLIRTVDDDREMLRVARRSMQHGSGFSGEMTCLRHGDERYALDLQIIPVHDEESRKLSHFVAILRDVTDRRAQLEALRHQALHDALTGLPNWSLLEDRLQQAVLGAERRDEVSALLLLDIDRFKDVNDTYGYAVGDNILRQTGERIREQIRSSDTVARAGEDEFAVLLPSVGGGKRRSMLRASCSRRSSGPWKSKGTGSTCRRASGSPSILITAATPTRCIAAPTLRCTLRRRCRAGSRSTRRTPTGIVQAISPRRTNCGAASTGASWCFTTSRRRLS